MDLDEQTNLGMLQKVKKFILSPLVLFVCSISPLFGVMLFPELAFSQNFASEPVYRTICRIVEELVIGPVVMAIAVFAIIYRAFTLFIAGGKSFQGQLTATVMLQLGVGLAAILGSEGIAQKISGTTGTCESSLTAISTAAVERANNSSTGVADGSGNVPTIVTQAQNHQSNYQQTLADALANASLAAGYEASARQTKEDADAEAAAGNISSATAAAVTQAYDDTVAARQRYDTAHENVKRDEQRLQDAIAQVEEIRQAFASADQAAARALAAAHALDAEPNRQPLANAYRLAQREADAALAAAQAYDQTGAQQELDSAESALSSSISQAEIELAAAQQAATLAANTLYAARAVASATNTLNQAQGEYNAANTAHSNSDPFVSRATNANTNAQAHNGDVSTALTEAEGYKNQAATIAATYPGAQSHADNALAAYNEINNNLSPSAATESSNASNAASNASNAQSALGDAKTAFNTSSGLAQTALNKANELQNVVATNPTNTALIEQLVNEYVQLQLAANNDLTTARGNYNVVQIDANLQQAATDAEAAETALDTIKDDAQTQAQLASNALDAALQVQYAAIAQGTFSSAQGQEQAIEDYLTNTVNPASVDANNTTDPTASGYQIANNIVIAQSHENAIDDILSLINTYTGGVLDTEKDALVANITTEKGNADSAVTTTTNKQTDFNTERGNLDSAKSDIEAIEGAFETARNEAQDAVDAASALEAAPSDTTLQDDYHREQGEADAALSAAEAMDLTGAQQRFTNADGAIDTALSDSNTAVTAAQNARYQAAEYLGDVMVSLANDQKSQVITDEGNIDTLISDAQSALVNETTDEANANANTLAIGQKAPDGSVIMGTDYLSQAKSDLDEANTLGTLFSGIDAEVQAVQDAYDLVDAALTKAETAETNMSNAYDTVRAAKAALEEINTAYSDAGSDAEAMLTAANNVLSHAQNNPSDTAGLAVLITEFETKKQEAENELANANGLVTSNGYTKATATSALSGAISAIATAITNSNNAKEEARQATEDAQARLVDAQNAATAGAVTAAQASIDQSQAVLDANVVTDPVTPTNQQGAAETAKNNAQNSKNEAADIAALFPASETVIHGYASTAATEAGNAETEYNTVVDIEVTQDKYTTILSEIGAEKSEVDRIRGLFDTAKTEANEAKTAADNYAAAPADNSLRDAYLLAQSDADSAWSTANAEITALTTAVTNHGNKKTELSTEATNASNARARAETAEQNAATALENIKAAAITAIGDPETEAQSAFDQATRALGFIDDYQAEIDETFTLPVGNEAAALAAKNSAQSWSTDTAALANPTNNADLDQLVTDAQTAATNANDEYLKVGPAEANITTYYDAIFTAASSPKDNLQTIVNAVTPFINTAKTAAQAAQTAAEAYNTTPNETTRDAYLAAQVAAKEAWDNAEAESTRLGLAAAVTALENAHTDLEGAITASNNAKAAAEAAETAAEEAYNDALLLSQVTTLVNQADTVLANNTVSAAPAVSSNTLTAFNAKEAAIVAYDDALALQARFPGDPELDAFVAQALIERDEAITEYDNVVTEENKFAGYQSAMATEKGTIDTVRGLFETAKSSANTAKQALDDYLSGVPGATLADYNSAKSIAEADWDTANARLTELQDAVADYNTEKGNLNTAISASGTANTKAQNAKDDTITQVKNAFEEFSLPTTDIITHFDVDRAQTDGSGRVTNLRDVGGANNNDATQTNTNKMPQVQSGAVGGVAEALVFDGVDDILLIDADPSIGHDPSGYTDRTLSIVFSADNTARRQVLYEEGGGWSGVNAYIDGGRLYLGTYHGGAIGVDPTYHYVSTEIDVGEPYDLKLEYTGGTLTGFVNGVNIGTVSGVALDQHADPGALGGVNGATYFHDGSGRDDDGNNYSFDGAISDVVMYDDVKTAGQADQLDGYMYGVKKGYHSDNPATPPSLASRIDDVLEGITDNVIDPAVPTQFEPDANTAKTDAASAATEAAQIAALFPSDATIQGYASTASTESGTASTEYDKVYDIEVTQDKYNALLGEIAAEKATINTIKGLLETAQTETSEAEAAEAAYAANPTDLTLRDAYVLAQSEADTAWNAANAQRGALATAINTHQTKKSDLATAVSNAAAAASAAQAAETAASQALANIKAAIVAANPVTLAASLYSQADTAWGDIASYETTRDTTFTLPSGNESAALSAKNDANNYATYAETIRDSHNPTSDSTVNSKAGAARGHADTASTKHGEVVTAEGNITTYNGQLSGAKTTLNTAISNVKGLFETARNKADAARTAATTYNTTPTEANLDAYIAAHKEAQDAWTIADSARTANNLTGAVSALTTVHTNLQNAINASNNAKTAAVNAKNSALNDWTSTWDRQKAISEPVVSDYNSISAGNLLGTNGSSTFQPYAIDNSNHRTASGGDYALYSQLRDWRVDTALDSNANGIEMYWGNDRNVQSGDPNPTPAGYTSFQNFIESNIIVDMQTNRHTNMYQNVNTVSGVEYNLNFFYKARKNSATGNDVDHSDVEVWINGVKKETIRTSDKYWHEKGYSFTGTGGPMKIEFRGKGKGVRGGMLTALEVEKTEGTSRETNHKNAMDHLNGRKPPGR